MEYRCDALLEWSDWTSGREERARAIAAALRRLVGSRFWLGNLHLITSASSGPPILAALLSSGITTLPERNGSPRRAICRRIIPWIKPTGRLLTLRPDEDAMPAFVGEAVKLAGHAAQPSGGGYIGLDLETWIAPYYRGDETADWAAAGDMLAYALEMYDAPNCYVLHPTIQDHLPPSESMREGFLAGSSSRATPSIVCIDSWNQWAAPKYRQPDAEARWMAQNAMLRARCRLKKRILRPPSERPDWNPSRNKPWYADEAVHLFGFDLRPLLSMPAEPAKLDEVCATIAAL